MACPICGAPAQPERRPFCSKRCADVDLGRWLGERYVVAGVDGDAADASPAPGGDDPSDDPDASGGAA